MNGNLDGFGIHGMALDYSVVFFFTGAAFCLFIYFWLNNRLDMDEEPKMQMMQDEEENGRRS